MSNHVKAVDTKSFDDSIKKGVSIVDFYADWCGPCRMMAPEFEAASETKQEVHFLKLNIDDNQEIAEKFSVTSIPTLIVFKDGEKINTLVGLQKKESILKALEIA